MFEQESFYNKYLWSRPIVNYKPQIRLKIYLSSCDFVRYNENRYKTFWYNWVTKNKIEIIKKVKKSNLMILPEK